MGLRERKKQQTREMILKNSMTLFTDKGVDAVGMRELAQVCGLGIGTYYNYFRSKEEVLFSLFYDVLKDAIARNEFDLRLGADDGDILANNYTRLYVTLMEHKNILNEFLVVALAPRNYATKDALGNKIMPELILNYWNWVSPFLPQTGARYSEGETKFVIRLMWHHFLTSLHVLMTIPDNEEADDINRYSSRHLTKGFASM